MKYNSSKDYTKPNLYILAFIMIFSTLFVVSTTIVVLYTQSINEYKERLNEIVSIQVGLLDSNAEYLLNTKNYSYNELEKSLYLHLDGFLNNLNELDNRFEYFYIKKTNDDIEFLFPKITGVRRLFKKNIIDKKSKYGVFNSIDSSGKKILAAYGYMNLLDIGVVVSIQIHEINRPFYRVSIIISLLTIFLVTLSVLFYIRIRYRFLNSLGIEKKNLLKANKKLKYEILEHHETEDELKESRAKLRKLIKLSPIPMLISNSDKEIEFYNYKFIETFGYSKEDFSNGIKLWNAIFPDKAYRLKALRAWLKIGSDSNSVETWNITGKFGNIRECEVFVVITNNTTFIVFNDVTKENKLKRDLVKAKEHAEFLSETKSDFLSTISHEIRTPINGVLGMADLLSGSDINEEQEKYIHSIKVSGNILLELINDLLDISKIEANMLVFESFDFNLKTLLENFIEIQSYKTEGKDLELKLDLHPNIPQFLHGDPGRIRQVLLNLVGNAFKFTKSGEIIVSVKKIEESETEVSLEFSVTDTGIGIDRGSIGKIFEKFTQEDASTTRKYGGTGLGLAISKKIVEAMGGEILVESTLGIGSKFSVFLSLLKQEDVRYIDKKANLLLNSIATIDILIFCDDAENCKKLSEKMKYWNVNINIANNEEKLLKKLYECKKSKHPIKILFIDIDNSKWDRLCGSIKTDPRIKDTKIAILTKFGIRGDVKHLSEIGISAYLTKPVKKADLHDSLLALINQKEKENQVITKHSIREMLWDNIVILVVDDNRINQKVATGILEKNGFIVDVVNSGKEAIEYLSERKYHIVLMDCNMPVLDGFETTKIIRSKESGVLDHSVPIVAMTANSSKSDREKCLRFGMSGFISKPIEPEGLIEIINRNLS